MISAFSIKKYLENFFHINFEVEEKIGKYTVTFSNTEEKFFSIRIEIKDDVRLTAVVEPEKYGKDFLETINVSKSEKRKIFIEYWNELGSKNLSLKINGQLISPNDFIQDFNIWNTFILRYTVSPYYEKEEEKDINVYRAVSSLICMVLSISEYTISGYPEGTEKITLDKKYERNPINRKLCLLNKGYSCCVCGLNFEDKYGEIGKDFIEVHHSLPVSQMGENHIVDPIKELFPVCPNCHAMLHRKNPPYSIDELKKIMWESENEFN